MIFSWLLGFFFALWMLPLHEAHADGDPLAKPTNSEARAHLARGNKLYELREFDKAIAAYKEGSLVEDAPVFQYNLAQAYRMSGKYQEALWHYDRFVKRTNPTGPLKDAIAQFTVQMKAELEKAASKQPPTEPAPAGDGKTPGDDDGEGGAEGPTGAPAVVVSEAPVAAPRAQWPWMVAGGGALALGGAALGFHLWADRTYDRAEKEMRDQSRRDELEDSANTRRRLAQGFGIAAVGAAGVAVFLFVRSRGSDETPTTALAPVVSPELAGMSFSGSW